MGIFIGLIIIYLFAALVETQNIRHVVSYRKLRLWNCVLALPLWFFMAFRNVSVGTDTVMYQYLYERFASNELIEIFSTYSMEKGFVTLCNLLGKIGLDYFGFQIIISSLIIIGFGLFIYRYSSNYAYSWFLFLTLLFFSRSMNICREMLAVSLSFLSLSFLLEKKLIRFIVSVFVIALFHKTAIVLFVVLPFVFIKNKKIKFVLLVGSCAVFGFFFSGIMSTFVQVIGKYSYLLDSMYTDVSGGIAQYFNILFALGVLYLFNRSFKNTNISYNHLPILMHETSEEYQNAVWKAYIYISIIFSFGGLSFGLADRAALYFSSIFLTIIPNCISREKIFSNKCLLILLITLILSIYLICVLVFRNNWQTSLPYSFFWTNTR